MCNRTSEFVADATPRNDGVDKPNDWAERIVAARTRRPFTSLEDFARETGLPKRALIQLADADAFRSIGLDRRAPVDWGLRERHGVFRYGGTIRDVVVESGPFASDMSFAGG